jgi:hypothetical protein
MEDPLDENLLIVSKGGLEVKGDVRLVEKLEALPPKKVRVRVYIDRAEKLAGDSFFDKLDPYCMCKLGEFKRFQTPVFWNVGVNPKFEHNGVLTLSGETHLEFTVMDHDKFSADDLCGNGTLELANIPDGWSGKVELTRPKQGIFKEDESMEEAAGKLFVTIKYDYEKVNALLKQPKERTWQDLTLFSIPEKKVWGHEQVMLGNQFKRTIEGSSNMLAYRLHLGRIRVVAASPRGEQMTTVLWKVTKKRFLDFTKHCGREKQFMQACRVSALEKQSSMKELLQRLIKRWEQEEQSTFLRSAAFMSGPEKEEAMDPSQFKSLYKGVKAHIAVRNALNLAGGSFWDKLDPYAKLKFKNSKEEMKTSVLQDAGSDPVWDCEGSLTYQGENVLEIQVYDYDTYSADDLIAVGQLTVEKFGQTNGFEGTVTLSLPGNKKKKTLKQMMIIIGIMWDAPRDPNATMNTTQSGQQKLLNSTM